MKGEYAFLVGDVSLSNSRFSGAKKKIRVTTHSDLPIRSVSTIISDYLTLFKERHALAFIPYNCLSLKTVSDEDCRWRTIATSK